MPLVTSNSATVSANSTSESLGAHLARSSSLPQQLLARAARLAELDQAFRHWASSIGPWGQSVRLANIASGRVAIYVTSPAALTPLRYRQDAVLDWFASRTGEACTHLSIKVRPAS